MSALDRSRPPRENDGAEAAALAVADGFGPTAPGLDPSSNPERDSNPCLQSATRFRQDLEYLRDVESASKATGVKCYSDFNLFRGGVSGNARHRHEERRTLAGRFSPPPGSASARSLRNLAHPRRRIHGDSIRVLESVRENGRGRFTTLISGSKVCGTAPR